MLFNKFYFLCSVAFILFTSAFQLNAQQYAEGEILVQFKSNFQIKEKNSFTKAQLGLTKLDSLNQEYLLAAIEKIGGNQNNRTFLFRFDSKMSLNELISAYKATNLFTFIEPNYLCNFGQSSPSSVIPNDSYFYLQWQHLNNNGADISSHLAWGLEQGDSSIVVAIIDSGLKLDHPEFSGRIWKNPNDSINGLDDDNNSYTDDHIGWDFFNNDNDPTDDDGHGTKVTAAAAANANNNFFYAGMDWNCKIMPLKVSNTRLNIPYSTIINAIYYAANAGADVINMSFGGTNYSNGMHQAVQYADSLGVVQVASMMNENVGIPYYPAAYPETIAVGATGKNDKRIVPNNNTINWGSNYGSHIDVVAPGIQIFSLSHTSNNYLYLLSSGTSMSSGIVSGLCALILAQDSSRTPSQVRQILRNSAEDLVGDTLEDTLGFDHFYGYGRINAYQALLNVPQGLEFSSLNQIALQLYPNPAHQYINAKFKGNVKQLKVYDLSGKIIIQQFMSKHSQDFRIDLDNVSRGVYFLSLYGKGGETLVSQKFIKR